MRTLIFAAVSCSALSLVPLAALADGQGPLQAAGYNPDNQMVCIYPEHEGILIRHLDCRPAQAWLSEREHLRQEFRDQQRRSLLRNQH